MMQWSLRMNVPETLLGVSSFGNALMILTVDIDVTTHTGMLLHVFPHLCTSRPLFTRPANAQELLHALRIARAMALRPPESLQSTALELFRFKYPPRASALPCRLASITVMAATTTRHDVLSHARRTLAAAPPARSTRASTSEHHQGSERAQKTIQGERERSRVAAAEAEAEGGNREAGGTKVRVRAGLPRRRA